MYEQEAKVNKIWDIGAVVFSDNLQEVLTTMEIILTMYQVDEEPDIVLLCKIKLLEGLDVLRRISQDDKMSEKFKSKL